MNLYVSLNTFKTALGVSVSDDDAEMLRILEAVSREADDICLRHFFVSEEARYYTAQLSGWCATDDILAVSGVAGDVNNDETYSQTWTPGTDYVLGPANKWPKTYLQTAKQSAKYLGCGERFLRITGSFGYGNGRNADPWRSTSLTGTLDSASDTSLTLSASGGVSAGQTLKIESEQVYVESVSGVTATVLRGVNGTTAAAHAAAAVKIAEYPAVLGQAVLNFAASLYNLRGKQGLKDIMIGEYRETLVWDDKTRDHFSTALGRLKRPALCAL